ncbi:unnamed protein product [Protopolystoma xenopodis]|uniref:Uncharacterized protein n=1 Tax=Protopolystoma xenopodis TaxID=117903 RepID=A0A3S5C247_9PLAT|nr:unnamed protein product [Protopolystoma xenopodis]
MLASPRRRTGTVSSESPNAKELEESAVFASLSANCVAPRRPERDLELDPLTVEVAGLPKAPRDVSDVNGPRNRLDFSLSRPLWLNKEERLPELPMTLDVDWRPLEIVALGISTSGL